MDLITEITGNNDDWSIDGLPDYEGELLHSFDADQLDPVTATQNVEFLLGMERDPRVSAAIQIRTNATVNRPCFVVAGGDRDNDLSAADFVRDVLLSREDVPQSGLIDGYASTAIAHGLLCGYGVAELMWSQSDRYNVIQEIRNRLPSRFTFRKSPGDADPNPETYHHLGYELRKLTTANPFDGVPLPAHKMSCFSFGSRTNHPRGFGLGVRLYWPVILKRRGLRSWMLFADKFAQPTVIAKIEDDLKNVGYSATEIEEIKQDADRFLRSLRSGSHAQLPGNVEVSLLEAQRGGGSDIYEALTQWFNSEIAEVVLGNVNYGTAQGLSGAPAQNDENVRIEIAKADADIFHDQVINRQLVRSLIDLNRDKFGDAAYPQIWRDFREEEDRTEVLNRWKLLFEVGYQPSPELVRETFGEGWQPIAPPPPTETPPQEPPAEPSSESPQFAEPSSDNPIEQDSEDGFDRFRDRAVAEGSKKFKALLNPVFALVNRATTMSEVLDGFQAIADNAKLQSLQKLLSQAMLATRLASEYEAIRLTEPDAIAFAEPFDPYNLPFAEAIDWFANKVSVTSDQLAQLRGQYRNEAFYISGLSNAALLEEMRSLTERIMTEGLSLDQFKAEFKQRAEASGWMPKEGISRRAESVFENNMRAAFSAGQFAQYTKPQILETYSEWEWRHRTPDPARARPHHLAQNGNIFPASANPPFWLPCGHRCRCKLIPREPSGKPFAQIEMRDRDYNGVTESAPYDPKLQRFLTDPGWGRPPTPQNREALLNQLARDSPFMPNPE